MKNLRIPAFLFLLSVAFGSLAGCSKNSTSPNTTTTPGSIPAVGSSFITVDNAPITTYDTIVATTIVDTVHHGSTVRELAETNGFNSGVSFFYESFLTDGDLALEGTSTGWGEPGVYEVLPFASHTTITTTFLDQASSTEDTITTVYNGAGHPILLNNQSYQTDSVTVTAFTEGTSVQYGYSFIPTLGLIAYDGNSGGYSEWLTSYSPK